MAFALILPPMTCMPEQAGADLTRSPAHKEFVFRGRIKQQDPVNLVYTGGSDRWGWGECVDSPRSINCVKAHLLFDWKRGNMNTRYCNSGSRLVFYKMGGGTVSASDDDSVSTSGTCKNQFHIRNWDDVEHGHSGNHHMFVVGAIHHEKRCAAPVACTHKIDMNWETAEDIAIQQMGAHQGSGDEWAHCTYPDYHRLAHTGPGKIKGKYSNGRVSRISFHHINDGGCRGQ